MPNQRASNKKQFGLTLTKEEIAEIDAAAQKLGITRTEFFRLAAKERLARLTGDKKKNDK